MAADDRLARAQAAFRERFGRAPEGVAEAPGRVNLIGEHLDYNDGLVLPVAIDRSLLVAYAQRADATVRVASLDYDEESCFALEGPISRDEAQPWSNYVRGAIDVALREGFSGCGLDLAVTGDVPVGAGLSSSAALEVATLGAMRAAWGLELDGRRLALLAQRAENDFVGVQCGVMDQLASALSTAGHAVLIDCRSLAVEQLPLRFEEQGAAIVVVDSGVRRRLEDSAYNARRAECTEAVARLRAALPGRTIDALRDVTEDDLARAALPETLLRRARHAVSELRRVHEGVRALRRGDLATFGSLMDASHASLRDDFEVSCPELDRLVELAQALPGVFGSRLTGAGFGGCTVSLVREGALPAFRDEVVARHAREGGREAQLLVCRASDGLRVHGAT